MSHILMWKKPQAIVKLNKMRRYHKIVICFPTSHTIWKLTNVFLMDKLFIQRCYKNKDGNVYLQFPTSVLLKPLFNNSWVKPHLV